MYQTRQRRRSRTFTQGFAVSSLPSPIIAIVLDLQKNGFFVDSYTSTVSNYTKDIGLTLFVHEDLPSQITLQYLWDITRQLKEHGVLLRLWFKTATVMFNDFESLVDNNNWRFKRHYLSHSKEWSLCSIVFHATHH